MTPATAFFPKAIPIKTVTWSRNPSVYSFVASRGSTHTVKSLKFADNNDGGNDSLSPCSSDFSTNQVGSIFADAIPEKIHRKLRTCLPWEGNYCSLPQSQLQLTFFTNHNQIRNCSHQRS